MRIDNLQDFDEQSGSNPPCCPLPPVTPNGVIWIICDVECDERPRWLVMDVTITKKQAKKTFPFHGVFKLARSGRDDSGLQRPASAWDSGKPFRGGEANMQLDDLSHNCQVALSCHDYWPQPWTNHWAFIPSSVFVLAFDTPKPAPGIILVALKNEVYWFTNQIPLQSNNISCS